jgi:ABC-type cobalamin transport system permease subunit
VSHLLSTVRISGVIRLVAIYTKCLAKWEHTIKLMSLAPLSFCNQQDLELLMIGANWTITPANTSSCVALSPLTQNTLADYGLLCSSNAANADIVIATWVRLKSNHIAKAGSWTKFGCFLMFLLMHSGAKKNDPSQVRYICPIDLAAI